MLGRIYLKRTVESKYKIINAQLVCVYKRGTCTFLSLPLTQTQAKTQVVTDVIINGPPVALKPSFSLDICPPHKRN